MSAFRNPGPNTRQAERQHNGSFGTVFCAVSPLTPSLAYRITVGTTVLFYFAPRKTRFTHNPIDFEYASCHMRGVWNKKGNAHNISLRRKQRLLRKAQNSGKRIRMNPPHPLHLRSLSHRNTAMRHEAEVDGNGSLGGASVQSFVKRWKCAGDIMVEHNNDKSIFL